jgi:parallel beta-helix repeat protein
MASVVKPMRITRARAVKPGLYEIADPKGRGALVVEGRGFELDLTGVHLRGGTGRPWTFEGVGLLLRRCRNVTVRGARVSGYKLGIVLKECRGVALVECDTSGCYDQQLKSTPEHYDPADWVDIFHPEVWQTYGYGITVARSSDCRVRGCVSKRAQNGVALVESSDCSVEDCDVSRNSGWGLWMHKACDNRIIGNNADWGVRCESEHYSAGGDAAGLMLSDDCCRNVIAHNSMTHGGDGFFLNGLNVAPSTDNLVAFNDASHSPHNAFESSFSRGNVFVGNIASNSRYGFWLGLSCENRVVGNIVENCLFDAMAIEHANHNVIAGNLIRRCRNGIALLARNPKLKASHHYEIVGNTIERCREAAVALSHTLDSRVVGNRIAHAAVALRLDDRCERIQIARNTIVDIGKRLAELDDSKAVDLDDNFWGIARVKSVLSKITINRRSQLRLERIARKMFPQPRRPVAVGYTSAARARDQAFHWYAELKHLVGL